MASFQIVDIYAQESGAPTPMIVRTISADSMSVDGSTAVFYTGGVVTHLFALSSQFVVEKVS